MKPNPLSDALHFLVSPAWPTVVYWLLLLGSIVIALYAWQNIPGQRSWRNVVDWLCRFFIGTMWWQQTLWKLPPLYTDNPSDPLNSGLHYWMTREGQSAAIPLQAAFVNHIVLPNFHLFAPIVYGLEVLTAASLILGVFVRLWGWIGALQVLNLWLGLYNADGEWPWTYFFLLVLMVTFAVHRYGNSLGLDAIMQARAGRRGMRVAGPVLSDRGLNVSK
jgi:thiosulfate dehydrogenase (quinone) large subunit